LWYDRWIKRGNELIGTQVDLPRRALVGCRTRSSSQCKVDPARLGSDLKLNFGYVVEDIKTCHLQKESPHLVQQCWSGEQRATAAAWRCGRSFRGSEGHGEVPHFYRGEVAHFYRSVGDKWLGKKRGQTGCGKETDWANARD
jgi:hypothetical protein